MVLLRFVIVYLIPIALAIFGVVDCLLTPRPYVRALPKPLWILLILMLYVVGPVLWIIAGRSEHPQGVPQRRATDLRSGLTGGGYGEAGPRRAADPDRPERTPRAEGPASGSGRFLAPDDDPEFLRRLGEQMRRERKDRPDS